MPRGERVQEGVTLEVYSTKLEPDTKKLLGALATVQKLDGQRDLINRMLEVYKEKYPQDFKKAGELLQLLGEGS